MKEKKRVLKSKSHPRMSERVYTNATKFSTTKIIMINENYVRRLVGATFKKNSLLPDRNEFNLMNLQNTLFIHTLSVVKQHLF